MPTETLLLLAHEDGDTRDVLETHARRLADRTAVDRVAVATYGLEPGVDLRGTLAGLEADRVYAVPMCAAHTYATLEDVPAALSTLDGEVRYCEPIGRNPAVTDAVADHAAAADEGEGPASLVLIGFGSGSTPFQRQSVEYHADRLRERGSYEEVVTCYLLQNPAVECVRYNVSAPRMVAVPLFLGNSEATRREIPEKLELDRGGIAYAEPLATHPRVTDAVAAMLARERTLALGTTPGPTSFEAGLPSARRPVATDGEGGRR
jgi:sirohydrochlorin ferrochelatase